jgi:hypothetical protein
MVPNMYRTAGLAVLLFNACISDVRAGKTNRMDESITEATTVVIGDAAASTSNIAQSTTAITRTEAITQSTVGVVSAGTILSEKPPAATNHAATLDLSTSFQNKTFLPVEIDGHEVPISCLNCSTTGTLQVSGTGLSLNENLIGSNDTHPFSGGVFTALLPHGLKGRIELGLSAPSTLSHQFNLSQVPITGFAIPGVADAGVTVDIGIQFSLHLSKPSEVSFGFEFEIPEHSSILIDVANEKRSTVRGFDNDKKLNFNILPVNVSDPSLDIRLSAALILDLAIGAELHDSDVVAEIGAGLTIPIMVDERQLSHVDSKCNTLGHGNSTQLTTQKKPATAMKSNLAPRKETHSLLGNYTNIIPSVGMEMNVFVAAGLQGSFGGHDLAFNTAFPLFKTAFTLPTTCINNHKATSTSSKTSTASAATATTTGGSPTSTATASSAAVGSLSRGESGEAFLWMGSSTALALAVAMGWLVVNF